MRQSMHVNAPRTAPRSRPGRRAFTLMEMLLVIAIIGLACRATGSRRSVASHST